MSARNCLDIIQKAAGRTLTDQELERIVESVEARIVARVRAGQTRFQAAAAAGRKLAGDELLAAVIEKRNAALNVRIRAGLNDAATPGREYDAVRAVLTGARGVFEGAAHSIDAMRHALRDGMVGGIVADLRKAGVLEAVTRRDKAFDHDVANELWAMRDPTKGQPTGNTHAREVAVILDKYQEALRGQLNEAGAWIGKLDNYIVRQSHDMWKIREAGFAAWRDAIEPRLDPRTFEGHEDRTAFLHNIWSNLATGVHETSTDTVLAGMTGPSNLAKQVSQERVLHFKSADAWWDYNERFGKGAVIDAVFHGIEKGTQTLALMRRLGTNPEAMLKGWVDNLLVKARDRGDLEAVEKLQKSNHDKVMDVLTGKSDMPGNATIAHIGSTVRVMESMARLGGVVLSSIPDLAVNTAMLRHNGIGIMESYARQMAGLLPTGAATREVAETLGVGIDHLLGNVMHRFQAEDGAIGKMSQAARQFYRLSGLTYWTDSLKASAGLMLSNNLAERAGSTFESLPRRLQNSLRRYGIEETRWTALAREAQIAADGRNYILPAHMADRDLAARVQAYIVDQVREGMTEPTAGNRAFATGGTQRGTVPGELVRLLMQFKQYAITYLDRSVGRELARDGKDVGGLAHLIVATSALGYLSMTLKELSKGRDFRRGENLGDYTKIAMAAMVQGGGLGIYGDFLFGDANRMGGGFIPTLAGPTVGTLEDVHKVLMAFREKAIEGQGHPIADAIGAAKNNTPFVNLFYTRMALDHLVLFRLQEWANPGYLQRYEARVKKENKQTFWLRPQPAF